MRMVRQRDGTSKTASLSGAVVPLSFGSAVLIEVVERGLLGNAGVEKNK